MAHRIVIADQITDEEAAQIADINISAMEAGLIIRNTKPIIILDEKDVSILPEFNVTRVDDTTDNNTILPLQMIPPSDILVIENHINNNTLCHELIKDFLSKKTDICNINDDLSIRPILINLILYLTNIISKCFICHCQNQNQYCLYINNKIINILDIYGCLILCVLITVFELIVIVLNFTIFIIAYFAGGALFMVYSVVCFCRNNNE